jgi:hypothetical protein
LIPLEQKLELSGLISDTYGTPEALAEHLDLVVEMLFCVEKDTFSREELQQVATAIRGGAVRVLRSA